MARRRSGGGLSLFICVCNARLRQAGCEFSHSPAEGQIFTYIRIYRVPDCAIARQEFSIQTVAVITAPKLSDNEKLQTLCRLDQFRQWHSLEEKRYCLVCGNLISGRQIQVAGGTRGNGPLRLSCPTERCNSIPMDWVLPTDEILGRVDKMAAEERKAAELKPAAVILAIAK